MSPRGETHSAIRPTGELPKTSCLVVGTCEGLPRLLGALARREGIEIQQSKDGGAGLAENRADVVLQATDGGSGWLAELTKIREHTDAPVVLVSSAKSPRMLDEALEAGVEDVLVLPEPVENVAFAIRRASRVRRDAATERATAHGQIATVFSPKGGTGKTVISTNLAATLAKHMGKRALLIDLDLQFGDAAIMLGVEPERTLSDLVSAPGALDSEKLAGYVSRHPSGLHVLAAPLRPENSEAVTDEGLARVLDVARESYEIVVIDTAPFFHGAVLTAVDLTDTLFVVCSPDIASLKNVHLSLRTLSLLSYPSNRVRLVLNHAHAGGGLKRSEVEKALEMKVAMEVPYDRSVRPALNRGVPAVLADAKGGLAVAVRGLAESILPRTHVKRRSKGLFSRS